MTVISIHASREGGDHGGGGVVHAGRISIHAPREGGDAAVFTVAVALTNFNPRPPRGGRRKLITAYGRTREFQSTPPARGGATPMDPNQCPHPKISIHAPREGGDGCIEQEHHFRVISIHAPREGGDVAGVLICQWHNSISIHAPREGGDRRRRVPLQRACNFNPRPPRGGATSSSDATA